MLENAAVFSSYRSALASFSGSAQFPDTFSTDTHGDSLVPRPLPPHHGVGLGMGVDQLTEYKYECTLPPLPMLTILHACYIYRSIQFLCCQLPTVSWDHCG